MPQTTNSKSVTAAPKPVEPAPAPAKNSSLFRLLAILIVVAAIIIGFLVIRSSNSNEPANTNSEVPNTSVTISKSGFAPATISIKAGTQVTWTNSDAKAHEVAADPYPKNDSIPGFDSTRALITDQSYKFRFNTPGTYHLHDQLNPLKFHATVIVK